MGDMEGMFFFKPRKYFCIWSRKGGGHKREDTKKIFVSRECRYDGIFENPTATFLHPYIAGSTTVFLAHSCHTHNPLDGEVIDLLAGICPEEFSVLSADLLQ